MKKILLTSLVAVFAVSAANAGVYVGGYAATSVDDGLDVFDMVSIDLTLGYAFENGIRLETDIYSQNVIKTTGDWEVGVQAAGEILSINNVKVAYDFKNDSKFTPYVGIGLSNIDWESGDTMDGIRLDGLFIAGVSYAINETWSIDLQYNRNWDMLFLFNKNVTRDQYNGSSTWKLGAVYKF